MKPTIGRIVTYCSQNARDYPAIITEVLPLADGRVHLQVFVPPSGSKDYQDPERGVPQGDHGGQVGTWRWPERV